MLVMRQAECCIGGAPSEVIAALLLTLPPAPAAVPQRLAETGELLKEATLQEELGQVGAKNSS